MWIENRHRKGKKGNKVYPCKKKSSQLWTFKRGLLSTGVTYKRCDFIIDDLKLVKSSEFEDIPVFPFV